MNLLPKMNIIVFYLFGFAGTGKTFLISRIVIDLILENKIDHVYVCAPTHKALNVIESYFRSSIDNDPQSALNKSISFMTIHKLLEFKPIIKADDGSKIFKSSQESKFLKKLEDKLIIIDECSMISKDMVTEIDKYINLYPVKIIFMVILNNYLQLGKMKVKFFQWCQKLQILCAVG